MTDETIEKIHRSDVGYRVKVKTKRGTGTRDQDEVTVEVEGDDPADAQEAAAGAVNTAAWTMDERRGDIEDGEDDD